MSGVPYKHLWNIRNCKSFSRNKSLIIYVVLILRRTKNNKNKIIWKPLVLTKHTVFNFAISYECNICILGYSSSLTQYYPYHHHITNIKFTSYISSKMERVLDDQNIHEREIEAKKCFDDVCPYIWESIILFSNDKNNIAGIIKSRINIFT